MSKKKAFSGNTMTLKDFHGGSIPSDIPLPSAPGVIVRQSDRPGYDRQTSWGNPMGRSDHRLRPSSSGAMRNLDDKTPFLTTTANIGRNFDEDERKPLDGALGPRRTVSDESYRGPATRLEPRVEAGRLAGQPGLGHVVPQVGSVSANSYSTRVVEGGHSGLNAGPLSGGSGGGGGGLYPNAWGMRRETVNVVVAEKEPGSSSWSGQSTVLKFAQASALDQISSGRWQTKPVHPQADVEVIKPSSESPNSSNGRENGAYVCGNTNYLSEKEYYEASLVRQAERGLAIEEKIHGGVREVPDVERVHSPALSDGREKSSVLYVNEGQPQPHPEVSERPKLKLLPRTKPLEAPESSGVEYKQPTINRSSEIGVISHGNAIHVKPGLSSNEASHVKPQLSNEAADRHVERPKLNLKPRSQPLDQSVASTEKERIALFGGARPREMVLKERGVDDVVPSQEEVRSPIRVKTDVPPRTESGPLHVNTSRHTERAENLSTGRGIIDKREQQRGPSQKADLQRKNWRNSRDPEKQQPQQERSASPETWRKPVESDQHPKSDSGLRFGKALSAAELVQAFSKTVPDPKPIDQFSSSNQRRLPGGRSQMPFSRLTGPTTTRPQINGY